MKKILLILTLTILAITMVSAGITNNGDGTVTLSYTLSVEDAQELEDALCYNHGYSNVSNSGFGNPVPNPESCQEFAQKKIKNFFTEHVKAYRYKQAEEAINTGSEININD